MVVNQSPFSSNCGFAENAVQSICPGTYFKFFIDIPDMGTNGLYTDGQFSGDLLIHEAVRKEDKDLLLAIRELFQEYFFHKVCEMNIQANFVQERIPVNHTLVVILLLKNLVECIGPGVDLKLLINIAYVGTHRFCTYV
jgi:hypothetical protein